MTKYGTFTGVLYRWLYLTTLLQITRASNLIQIFTRVQKAARE
jgi:hypothetical protein